MATIINKGISGNALVLSQKEAILYPFSLGNWSQIRLGLFISQTSASDTNAQYVNETLAGNSSQNGFYVGLVNNIDPNNLLPYGPNQQFIGIGTPTGVASTYNTQTNDNRISNSTNNSSLNAFVTIGSGFQTSQNAIPGSMDAAVDRIYLPDKSNVTGAANFASFYCIKFELNNAGQTTQNFNVTVSTDSASSYTNVSVDNLRALMSNFGSPSATITGLRWVAPLGLTGMPLSLPSGILIYSPLSNNRLRIHCLDIDKY